MATYPLYALRTLALYAQGLNKATHPASPGLDELYAAVERIGCVQIDTLQMVQRSHYLALWSRLGRYDPADFDRLIYDPAERRLFEGWQHAASIIPLADYRYQIPYQRNRREQPSDWYIRWLEEIADPDLVPRVLEHVRQNGAVRAADFEYHGPRRSSWWDWKPAKVALEFLFAFGELMITNRVKFQRVYDLSERVRPAWVELQEPSAEERDRFWIEQGVKALGVCTPGQAADYSYRKRGQAKAPLAALLQQGTLVEIQGELANGAETLLVHKEHLPRLEQAADGSLAAKRTTFLSPFDSLFWARGRDMQLWNFHKTLECYVPAPKRIWGYFCLPILHHDRLVGRFDPKLERSSGTLHLRALYLEPGIAPEDELVADVAAAMRDFMAFHQAKELVIERSQPEEFGARLARRI